MASVTIEFEEGVGFRYIKRINNPTKQDLTLIPSVPTVKDFVVQSIKSAHKPCGHLDSLLEEIETTEFTYRIHNCGIYFLNEDVLIQLQS